MEIQVHPQFTTEVPSYSVQLQSAINQCLTKLRRRQWDVGLRVKRLKGFPRRVWEARVDRSNRLIFTFGTVPDTAPTPQTVIEVWAVVAHDDVNRTRRRTFNGELQFLEGLDTPEHVQDFVDDEGAIEAHIAQDLADARALMAAHPIDPAIWQPLSEAEWADLVLSGKIEQLETSLTIPQLDLLKEPGTLLVSGAAGSGKTTVAIFRLLQKLEAPQGPMLYLAYNPWLVDHARTLFKRLLPPGLQDNSKVWDLVQFSDIQTLARDLLGDEAGRYPDKQKVTYPIFVNQAKRWRTSIKPATAWAEIRSIVKGASRKPHQSLLGRSDYLALGKKRAPDLQLFRSELYQLAERYQTNLEQTQRFDEIDLIRRAMRSMPDAWRGRYMNIVCDEVQDLTELHLELVFRLLHSDGEFMCTGDLNQIINPSGFRWNEVNSLLYKRRSLTRDPIALKENFRSVGHIIDMANGLLNLRKRLLNEAFEVPQQENYRAMGDVPGLVTAGEDVLLSALRELTGSYAILVRSEDERNHLREALNSSFVFTIEEAKGLEFDGALVWNFFSAERALWQKVLENRPLSERERPALRHDFNMLYVAVTRARRKLRVFDPHDLIWNVVELVGHWRQMEPTDIASVATKLSSEEWVAQGDYYKAHDFFEQAMACYERAGKPELSQRIRAEQAEREERWLDAAQASLILGDPGKAAEMYMRVPVYLEAAALFLDLGQRERAADAFKQASLWDRAAALYQELGDHEQAERCRTEGVEEAGRYNEAALGWLKLGEEARALASIRSSQDKAAILLFEAELHEAKGEHARAAERYTRLEEHQKAGECWEKVKDTRKALEAYTAADNQEACQRLRNALYGGLNHTPSGHSHVFSIDKRKKPPSMSTPVYGLSPAASWIMKEGAADRVQFTGVIPTDRHIEGSENDPKNTIYFHPESIVFVHQWIAPGDTIYIGPQADFEVNHRTFHVRVSDQAPVNAPVFGLVHRHVWNEAVGEWDVDDDIAKFVKTPSTVTEQPDPESEKQKEQKEQEARVRFFGTDLNSAGQSLGYLLQRPADDAFMWMGFFLDSSHTVDSFIPALTAWDDAATGRRLDACQTLKHSARYQEAYNGYDRLFGDFPAYPILYKSAFKTIAGAGHYQEAERAIQLYALLRGVELALRGWTPSRSDAQSVRTPAGCLALAAAQYDDALMNLGAIRMIRNGKLGAAEVEGYLNSIRGFGDARLRPNDDRLTREGRKQVLYLPWEAAARTPFIQEVLQGLNRPK